MNYGVGTPQVSDFTGVVERANDLQRLTRSTVPLLCWWRDNGAKLALPNEDGSALACFEYPVPARCNTCGGRGKDSFSDVMVTTEGAAVAFEAKFTEPRYETVTNWMAKDSGNGNRARVASHWLHLIGAYTGTTPEIDAIGQVVYQMLHRTASACAVAESKRRAGVTYLVFDGGHGQQVDYTADLTLAARTLDPKAKMDFSVVSVPTRRGPAFAGVEARLTAAENDAEAAELIADAIVTGGLYDFERPIRRVIEQR